MVDFALLGVGVPGNSPSRIVRFATFEVNVQTGELHKQGQKLRVQEQPFQVLTALLERPGEIVTREELRSRLWPDDTFVDFDHSLNAAIKRLRDVLGESAQTPMFIETLSRRGYRFIYPVDGHSGSGGIVTAEQSKISVPRHWIPLTFLALSIIACCLWLLWHHLPQNAQTIERRLTANSSENDVDSAALSPDGRYLAYVVDGGILLKLIRTGETHAVRLPPDFYVRVDDWFPDSAHLLVSRKERQDEASSWSISVFGGPPSYLGKGMWGGSVSPDGAYIAFRRGSKCWVNDGLFGQEVWVMRSDGTNPVKLSADNGLSSSIGKPSWSPDGKRIAYARTNCSPSAVCTSAVEVNEWQNDSSGTLFSAGGLISALNWFHGGLVYALQEDPPHQQDSSLWKISLQQSGKICGPPSRIVSRPGRITQLTISTDGKAAMYLGGASAWSVYTSELLAGGTRLVRYRRLTADEYSNGATAWTPDSKAILFFSDRNGTQELYRQEIDQASPERLATSAEDLDLPARLTPDGSEILYLSRPKSPGRETPTSIFAIPIGGGVPRFVLRDVNIYNVQCARLPSTVCLYTVSKEKTFETFRFDPKNGNRLGPPQIDLPGSWSLSPDGSQRAIVVFDSNKVQFRSTSTGESHDLIVKGWSGLKNIDWSADGKSLFIVWHNHEWDSALLNVALDGRASVLLRSSTPDIGWAIPSPDGHLLAISRVCRAKNAWLIENF